MSQDALFDAEPSARLHKGDRVRVQTMWGIEFCTVEKVTADQDDFPLVQLKTQSGDRITMNIARVERDEDDENARPE